MSVGSVCNLSFYTTGFPEIFPDMCRVLGTGNLVFTAFKTYHVNRVENTRDVLTNCVISKARGRALLRGRNK